MYDKIITFILAAVSPLINLFTVWFSWKKVIEVLGWFKNIFVEGIYFIFDKVERLYFMFIFLSLLYYLFRIVSMTLEDKREEQWVDSELNDLYVPFSRMLLYVFMLLGALFLYSSGVDFTGEVPPRSSFNRVILRLGNKVGSVMNEVADKWSGSDKVSYADMKEKYNITDEDMKELKEQVVLVKKHMIEFFPVMMLGVVNIKPDSTGKLRKKLEDILYKKYVEGYDFCILLDFYVFNKIWGNYRVPKEDENIVKEKGILSYLICCCDKEKYCKEAALHRCYFMIDNFMEDEKIREEFYYTWWEWIGFEKKIKK